MTKTAPRRVAVLSAGAWGTALGLVCADAGHRVVLHARRPEVVRALAEDRTNPRALPGIRLPEGVTACADPAEALRDAEFLILSVSAQHLRENLVRWAPLLGPGTVVVSAMKGVETGSGLRMSQVIAETTGLGEDRIAVLSGPNLAREVAARRPTTCVVACADEAVARECAALVRTPAFRPYTATDVVGCEVGGAVKNVVALAVGPASALAPGDGARAALITRGLAETTRLGVALGARPETFAGLAGAGDLLATCASPLSRNRAFGERLGRGMTPGEAVAAGGGVAEGVATTRAVLALARARGVELPIAEAVGAVLAGRLTPRAALDSLTRRAPGPEHVPEVSGPTPTPTGPSHASRPSGH
ncbi:NAD(P)H-dependent glycerol-3-phosphate dehydrogenase (plasmid) [Streptomyces sp. BI20]|uniref:NAD(P)H-dependent glycerol-3-phosphate dehydrogenase n=1 Tax=Streptomyces sp. BI20 TaxID=3403460 RepID=UPI003C728365